jgi:hypothetical protein
MYNNAVEFLIATLVGLYYPTVNSYSGTRRGDKVRTVSIMEIR